MRNQQAAVCRTTVVAAVTLKNVSLPTFIRTPLTGHLFFWDIWGGWAAMAQRCHPRQCTLGIYLWEGFWNGFLLGQTCEIPATARGNHFRTVVCLDSLDSLDMFICCTGIRLLVEEQKMAETVLADLIITEIHWHWVVPAYLPLAIFIFGKGSGMVSCLAKCVKYQLLQGETILELLYA